MPTTPLRRTITPRIPTYAEDTEAPRSLVRRVPPVKEESTIRPQRGVAGTEAAPAPSPINPIKTPPAGGTPVRPAPARPARPPGMTNTPGSVPSQAQANVDAAKAKLAQVGPGYVGSIHAAPGSYTEARPAGSTPVRSAGPGTAPGHGGIDVRSYTGSLYSPGGPVPNPGYQPQPSAEASADRVLRARFGPPPNERGQIDVSRAPTPPDKYTVQAPRMLGEAVPGATPNETTMNVPPALPPQQQTEAANPLTGDRTAQPEGTTTELPSNAREAGFIQRGQNVPRGTDAAPGGTVGGSGLYARKFASPQSASAYAGYVKRLFGDPQIA